MPEAVINERFFEDIIMVWHNVRSARRRFRMKAVSCADATY